MDAIIACPGSETVLIGKASLDQWYGFQCSGGSIPSSSPISMGLSDLAWSDVSLLIGSLLLSCCIAYGWNLIGKMFHRG